MEVNSYHHAFHIYPNATEKNKPDQNNPNVIVSGIICRDPHIWTIVPTRCQNVKILDVKMIGLWRYNTDGIDVVNSQNVFIEDCFVRAFDDKHLVSNIHFKNLVIQGTHILNKEEGGIHVNEFVENVQFE